MEKEQKRFKQYLQSMFSDKQITVLAFCLRHQVPVCFYGTGLGKSTLAKLLKQHGFAAVYAPEDCGGEMGAMTVLNVPNAVAIRIKKEPFQQAMPNDSFLTDDITAVLWDALKRAH